MVTASPEMPEALSCAATRLAAHTVGRLDVQVHVALCRVGREVEFDHLPRDEVDLALLKLLPAGPVSAWLTVPTSSTGETIAWAMPGSLLGWEQCVVRRIKIPSRDRSGGVQGEWSAAGANGDAFPVFVKFR